MGRRRKRLRTVVLVWIISTSTWLLVLTHNVVRPAAEDKLYYISCRRVDHRWIESDALFTALVLVFSSRKVIGRSCPVVSFTPTFTVIVAAYAVDTRQKAVTVEAPFIVG